MAPPTKTSKPVDPPTEIIVHQQSRRLEVAFGEDERYSLAFEFMRVHSPSAAVQGHGPGQEVLQVGKREVTVTAIEPVGHYAIKPVFSDGHESGIFTWAYLRTLGREHDRLWSVVSRSPRPPPVRAATMPPPGDFAAHLDQFAGSRVPARVMIEHDSTAGRQQTHFGFDDGRPRTRRPARVADVFHSVAAQVRPDERRDVGRHASRLEGVHDRPRAVRPGARVLDIAGGTGDLARAMAKKAGPTGEVWLTDINESMLAVGRDRLVDAGMMLPTALADAEQLPFPDARISIA